MNERAVNIKQNKPHHLETLPESKVFCEFFQEVCRVAVVRICPGGSFLISVGRRRRTAATRALPANYRAPRGNFDWQKG
jgi:hypothetical protein